MKHKSKEVTMLLLLVSFFLFSETSVAQEKERLKDIEESEALLSDAGEALQKDEFPTAEADYRKAISLNPEEEVGKYNLGNAYYNKEKNDEAMSRFKQAASVAENKPEKHKAFHNLGNTFMNAKKYQEAVESYKNALRNNPTDEETRYNLALAKDMLEKNPPQGGGGDDDKNEDQQDQKENQENQDENKEKEGDDGEEKEDQDKGDEKDENKQGDKENENGNPEQPKEEKEQEGDQKKQQQPVPGQLSPQQVKNLLEAMNNEEKKVQDKINAKKQKGAKVRSNKDW